MRRGTSRFPVLPCLAAVCAVAVSMPAVADQPDAREVTLSLAANAGGGLVISVSPESASISRGENTKIKKVYWVAATNELYPQLFWELRWDPDKGGATENYFGDVDLACGVASLKVQPDKPKIPNAEWPYAVTVFNCVDGAKGEVLATVDPRIIWND
jgi:hypothetical protein